LRGRSAGFSRISRILEDFENSRGIHEIFKLKKWGSGRFCTKTDHFHCRASGRGHFLSAFSLSEPAGSKRSRTDLKSQNEKGRTRDLSVSTAESLVAELVPIGMERQQPRKCFSHFPRTRPGAEAGRPVSKSILIGAPIPYAERPPAGIHGEAAGGDRESHSFNCCARTSHRM